MLKHFQVEPQRSPTEKEEQLKKRRRTSERNGFFFKQIKNNEIKGA